MLRYFSMICLVATSAASAIHGAHPESSGVVDEDSRTPSQRFDVHSVWDVRYSDAEGSAGLGDLLIPIDPNVVIEPRETDSTPVDRHALAVGDEKPLFGEGPERLIQPIPIRVIGPRRPAVVLVHGGGWVSGDKWVQGGYAKALAQSGIVVFNINYRLAPKHPFPAMVDDVRTALIYLSKHADALSLDLDRVGLCGYSAGGHLTSLVAVMGDEPRETQLLSSNWAADDPRWEALPSITCVCVGGPPCDFRSLPLQNVSMAYFLGGSRADVPENYLGASVTAHVSPQDPPIRMIHGEKDFIVPISNSKDLLRECRRVGVSAELICVEGEGHLVTFMHHKTKRAVAEFFEQQLLTRSQANGNVEN